MEKLFISCPMRGRSDAEIKATMEQMQPIKTIRCRIP